MAIDIGAGAADYDNIVSATYTMVDLTNPANENGTIDTFEVWHNTDGTGVKVGTFSGSGTSYTGRDYELLGNVTSGSKQTFTGKNCDCQTGDFIGWYSATGNLEKNNSGGDGIYYVSGDKFGAGAATYTLASGYKMAAYGYSSGGQPARKRMAGNPFTPFRKGVW